MFRFSCFYILAFTLLFACTKSGSTLDDALAEKRQIAAANIKARFLISEQLLTYFEDSREELDLLTNEKILRMEAGEPIDDLMIEDQKFKSELDMFRKRMDNADRDLIASMTDLYGLMGAILSYCESDVDELIEAINLQNLDSILSEGTSAQTMFWDRKFGYRDFVARQADQFSCAEKVRTIDLIVKRTKTVQNQQEHLSSVPK